MSVAPHERHSSGGQLAVTAACIIMPFLNALGPILTRRFELHSNEFANEGKFLMTTTTEVIKLLLMLLIIHWASLAGKLGAWEAVMRPFLEFNVSEMGMYALPAFCYCVDNNLTMVALQCLRPHTLQVLASSKILVTALLFKCFLGKPVTLRQWFFLVTLVIGMCIAQTFGKEQGAGQVEDGTENLRVGVPVVLLFVGFGAFANIWIEYLFKNVDTSEYFIVRNARLYVCGVLINAVMFSTNAVFHEGGLVRAWWSLCEELQNHGLWILASNNAVAGLFTAVIFNFADNIVAILLQGVVLPLMIGLQWCFYSEVPNLALVVGALMVTASIIGVNAKSPPSPESSSGNQPSELTSLVEK